MNKIEKNYNDNKQKIYRNLVKKNLMERDKYMQSYNKYVEKQDFKTFGFKKIGGSKNEERLWLWKKIGT